MLEAPTPIYLVYPVQPDTFSAWAFQGPAGAAHRREVYASISVVTEENSGEVLREIALLDEGSEATFGICVNIMCGIPST